MSGRLATIRFLGIASVIALSASAWAQTTWYVDCNCPSPPGSGTADDPFCSIQDAIDAASTLNGDTVLVRPGTYYETIDFNGKALTVRAVHASSQLSDPLDPTWASIIDADGTGSVVTCDNSGGQYQAGFPRLHGFTITHGHAENGGGGMWNYAASPTVTDCVFVNNDGCARGGGMLNEGGSEPYVTGCVFRANTALGGGGISNQASSPDLVGCVFEGNTTYYGGAGLRNEEASSPTVINCEFSNNVAGIGGGVFNLTDSNALMVNCIFENNIAERASHASGGGGGGVFSEDSNPTLINCTLRANQCTGVGPGGGIFIYDGRLTVVNCILWGNSDSGGMDESAQMHDEEASSSVVSYSCMQGCSTFCSDPNDHNIGDDPLLTPDGHLSRGSPCIDAADTTAVPPDLFTDLDGKGRRVDDRCTDENGIPAGLVPVTVDMGAYEYQGLPGDLDDDNDVDLSDLAALLSVYGTTCP